MMLRRPTRSPLFPYTTLFRSDFKRLLQDRPCPMVATARRPVDGGRWKGLEEQRVTTLRQAIAAGNGPARDRKSTRLNSSHMSISYAVFCLKKKNTNTTLLITN